MFCKQEIDEERRKTIFSFFLFKITNNHIKKMSDTNHQTIQAPSSNSQSSIGFWTLTTLVTGNLVGAGTFMLPATLAAFGSICLCGWITTTIGAIVLSLIFANLSANSKNTGGPHVYVEETFGKTAGFFTAWCYWVLSWVSNAGLAVGAIGYISPLFGGFDTSTIFLLETALLILLSLINLAGIHFAGRFEVLLTLCKVIPLIVLPCIGIFYINPDNFIPFNATSDSIYGAINATAYITLWCFIGLETGTVPGSEVKNPQRTIPYAILSGTCLAAIIYILGTISIIGVVPKEELLASKAPYAALANALFGGTWAIPVGILASIACIGALNGWVMVVSRIAHNAAETKLFPAFFKVTTKTQAPLWGTIVSTIFTIPIMALSLSDNLIHQFNFIIEFSVCIVLIIYLACVISYIISNKKSQKLRFPQSILGAIGVIFCVWTLTQASLTMLIASLSIVIAGWPVWIWVKRHQDKP